MNYTLAGQVANQTSLMHKAGSILCRNADMFLYPCALLVYFRLFVFSRASKFTDKFPDFFSRTEIIRYSVIIALHQGFIPYNYLARFRFVRRKADDQHIYISISLGIPRVFLTIQLVQAVRIGVNCCEFKPGEAPQLHIIDEFYPYGPDRYLRTVAGFLPIYKRVSQSMHSPRVR
jgi:hypothetical protein